MNRLWVRISLIFTAVIVVGIALFFLTTSLFIISGQFNGVAIPIGSGFAPPPLPTGRWSLGLLMIFLVGGIFSILAGVLASRQLIRPLNQLAETARLFGRRNMSVRAVVRGSSEIRAVASAFNEMAADLAEAESLRRGMLADVAHELRTPLTVLQANIQAILDDIYPMNKEEIGGLAAQVDLLNRLVNDLHLLAQAEAKQLPMRVEPVELNSLITHTLDKFDAVAQTHEIALRTDFLPGKVVIDADPVRLAQVLTNLIQNAITHTPDSGRVTVTLRHSDQKAIIQVRDTGSGIPKDKQAFIFARFYRVDPSRDRASGGAGLGLAIVKAIVEMHNGHIDVSSAGVPSLGTTFTMTLPCQQPATAVGQGG